MFEDDVLVGVGVDEASLAGWLDAAPDRCPVAVLVGVDPAGLSAGARVDVLVLLERQKRWLEAAQQRVLAAIGAADDSALGLAQEVVSLALRVPPRAAQRKLVTAASLVGQLPATLGLLGAGVISGRQAEVITEASWALDPRLVAALEQLVCPWAGEQSTTQTARAARRAVARLDPAGAQARHEHAVAGRRVSCRAVDESMVELSVLLEAGHGQLVFQRLTAATGLLPPSDQRSLDQQRADLFLDAILTGLPTDGLPAVRGHRPEIQVVIAADTLLGLDEQPAELTGHGPITADTARRYAYHQCATWRRLLTDPDTGQLLDLSPTRYRPGQRLRDFITARDEQCCFPTCTQPGYRCEYEHITAYQHGGRTCRCGGALACRRHNQCKINTAWTYTRNPDGSFTWTDDTGHHYTSRPPQRWHTDPPTTPSTESRFTPRTWTETELQAREDTDYQHTIQRWQHQLEHAQHTGDTTATTTAHNALHAAHQQRQRQLNHRTDPTQPPF